MQSKNLDLPDVDLLENISNRRSRLVPRFNFHDKFFTQLGFKEQTSY
jgi:hypothetical protein